MDAIRGKELEKRSFFWEHGRSCAVYKDGWKLVAHRAPWKLFNLNNDPVENSTPGIKCDSGCPPNILFSKQKELRSFKLIKFFKYKITYNAKHP